MPNDDITSSAILKLRLKRRETQEEFADIVGVTPTTVSNWERKNQMPRSVVIVRRLRELFKQANIGR